ncbi:MAG: permease [Candidatus Neomarinimicrobiota bacterium]
MSFINNYFHETYYLLLEMAPYLLLGFLIAGILKYYLRPSTMRRFLGGSNLRSVINAALLGVPMPLCSCGVIPTGVGLHRNGASKGAAVSFLISTPQTGVDSIMITYSLLGLPFAIIRPIVAFITGIAGGAISNKLEGSKGNSYLNESQDDELPKGLKKIPAIFKYAFVEFLDDIAKWLIIGILIAGLISVLVPDNFFLEYLSNPYLAMVVMLLVSVPLYVCATSSVPIAAALIMKGLSPGAALVFLMAGPATNAATISVIGNALGKKTLAIYLSTIIAGSFIAGALLDNFMPGSWYSGIMSMGHEHTILPQWLMQISALVLSALLLYSLVVKLIKRFQGKPANSCEMENQKTPEILINIEGMSCEHCVMSVKKGLSSLDGVENVSVNLETKTARIYGVVDIDKITETIKELGYTIKEEK